MVYLHILLYTARDSYIIHTCMKSIVYDSMTTYHSVLYYNCIQCIVMYSQSIHILIHQQNQHTTQVLHLTGHLLRWLDSWAALNVNGKNNMWPSWPQLGRTKHVCEGWKLWFWKRSCWPNLDLERPKKSQISPKQHMMYLCTFVYSIFTYLEALIKIKLKPVLCRFYCLTTRIKWDIHHWSRR